MQQIFSEKWTQTLYQIFETAPLHSVWKLKFAFIFISSPNSYRSLVNENFYSLDRCQNFHSPVERFHFIFIGTITACWTWKFAAMWKWCARDFCSQHSQHSSTRSVAFACWLVSIWDFSSFDSLSRTYKLLWIIFSIFLGMFCSLQAQRERES